MIQKSFLFNSVRVKHVPWHGQDVHPETGIAFYVSSGIGPSAIGVRVYPDGHKELCNGTPNKQGKKYGHGKETYLQFKQPWAPREHIYASRAVYLAWHNKPIEPGMTIDHIDGCTTNNDYRNLRQVSGAINSRDGGFSRKLKGVGIDPTTIQRWMLLRYFKRMVLVKEALSYKQYRDLSEKALRYILEAPKFSVENVVPMMGAKWANAKSFLVQKTPKLKKIYEDEHK